MYTSINELPVLKCANGDDLVMGVDVCLNTKCCHLPQMQPESKASIVEVDETIRWLAKRRGLCTTCYANLCKENKVLGNDWSYCEQNKLCLSHEMIGRPGRRKQVRTLPSWATQQLSKDFKPTIGDIGPQESASTFEMPIVVKAAEIMK